MSSKNSILLAILESPCNLDTYYRINWNVTTTIFERHITDINLPIYTSDKINDVLSVTMTHLISTLYKHAILKNYQLRGQRQSATRPTRCIYVMYVVCVPKIMKYLSQIFSVAQLTKTSNLSLGHMSYWWVESRSLIVAEFL